MLDEVAGAGFLRAAPGVGDVVPAGPTAAGKLYSVLAAGEPMEDEARFGDGEAEEIRRLGFALNRDGWIDGLSVVGVPIWQATARSGRELVAVMALAAASPRLDGLGERRVAERLVEAAERVSARLGAMPKGGRR